MADSRMLIGGLHGADGSHEDHEGTKTTKGLWPAGLRVLRVFVFVVLTVGIVQQSNQL